MTIENIIIGKPIVNLETLIGIENNKLYNWQEVTVYEDERYLPKLLVKYGFTSSIREVKRNRKDLDVMLDKLDFMEIKLGKKKICLVIGE